MDNKRMDLAKYRLEKAKYDLEFFTEIKDKLLYIKYFIILLLNDEVWT